MQYVDDEKNLLRCKIAIEDYVLWKAGNENPAHPSKEWGSESADPTSFWSTQQRTRSLTHRLLPSLNQFGVRSLLVIVCLLNNRECGSLGDAQFGHCCASFSRKAATRLRPFNSSGAITSSLVCSTYSGSVSRRERCCSLFCRIRLRMNSLGVPKSPEDTRSVIVTVRDELLDPTFLCRRYSYKLMEEFLSMGIDPCGERGEFHTFVTACPAFSQEIRTVSCGTNREKGCTSLDLSLA